MVRRLEHDYKRRGGDKRDLRGSRRLPMQRCWRVVNATNAACVSTNVKPFSVRPTTNTTFSFFVNDDSLAGDAYCSTISSSANLGVLSNAPKASLMGILTNYSLRGGGGVCGHGNLCRADRGGRRIRLGPRGQSGADSGQPQRSFSTGCRRQRCWTSAGPVSGDREPGSDRQQRRRPVRERGERHPAQRAVPGQPDGREPGGSGGAPCVRTLPGGEQFQPCLPQQFHRGEINQWLNGVMWNSQAIIHAATNQALTVSNSILGQAGTALFGNQAVAGNHGVVWGLPLTNGVGSSCVKFTVLQSSTLGWDRCAYADPLFANTAGGDYHLQTRPVAMTPIDGFRDDGYQRFAGDRSGRSGGGCDEIEPDPNGSRLNAGLYGGTAQASKSRTNAWLQLLTYMDGAPLSATDGGVGAVGRRPVRDQRDGTDSAVARQRPDLGGAGNQRDRQSEVLFLPGGGAGQHVVVFGEAAGGTRRRSGSRQRHQQRIADGFHLPQRLVR